MLNATQPAVKFAGFIQELENWKVGREDEGKNTDPIER